MLGLNGEVLPGQRITAYDSTALIRYAKSQTPRQGPGEYVRGGSGGVTRWRPPASYKKRWPLQTSPALKPFDLISLIPVSGSATQYHLTLEPGVVNSNLFPKIGGNPMWVMVGTTVAGITTYAFPTITVTKGDTVFLQGTVTAGLLTDVAIMSAATVTAETDSITTFIIGTCDASTGAWTQINDGNLDYQASVQFYSSTGRALTHYWSKA